MYYKNDTRTLPCQVTDPAPQPYQITHKTIALCVIIYSFGYKQENKRFEPEYALNLYTKAVLVC